MFNKVVVYILQEVFEGWRGVRLLVCAVTSGEVGGAVQTTTPA